MFSSRAHRSTRTPNFTFHRDPTDDLKSQITPRVCGGATSRSLELKIMLPSRRPHHADVRNHSLHLPRFYSRIQVHFLFLPRIAFCSFTPCILHKSLFPLWFLNGGESVWTGIMPVRSQHCYCSLLNFLSLTPF